MDLDSDRNANQIGSYDDESAPATPSGASQPQQSYGFDEQNTQGGSVIIDHETGRTPDRIICWCSFGLKEIYCLICHFFQLLPRRHSTHSAVVILQSPGKKV